MNKKAISDAILEKTKEGSITLWTERIAQLSRLNSVNVELIDWSGSPATVAGRVASHIANGGRNDDFLGAIGFITCS